MTVDWNTIVIGLIAILGFLSPWVGIILSFRGLKNNMLNRKNDEDKEKTEKALALAEEKGMLTAHRNQTDKEIGAIWTEITQHGAKIQVVETTTISLGQKMDSMMDILKEIKQDVKDQRSRKD